MLRSGGNVNKLHQLVDDAIEKLPKLNNPSGELSASSDLQRIFNLTDKEAQKGVMILLLAIFSLHLVRINVLLES